MDLDARDRKLLCLLDQDARRPLSHLSKKLNISKQAVRQRVVKLRAAGIISSPYTLVNAFALGRIWGRLWIRLQMAGPEVENEMLEFAKAQKDISWAVSLTGAYDFLVIYWSRSISDFKSSADEFLYKFSNYVKEHDLSFITVGHDFSIRTFSPEVQSVESLVKETAQVELDATDRKVLGVLAKNADLSAIEIGKRAGVDPKTVYYRMRRLEEKKVILNYRLEIDHPRIGYTWFKFFLTFSNPDKRKIGRMMEYLRQLPELIYITESVGPSDLEFEVVVPGTSRMQEILLDLRNTFSEMIKDYKYVEIREARVIRYFPEG